MESRKSIQREEKHLPTTGTELPKDYLKMVADVFSKHFAEQLAGLSKLKSKPRFEAHGMIFVDEVCLSLSLLFGSDIGATTVTASLDFDSKASRPTAEELLSHAVDGIGAVLAELFGDGSKEELERILADSLAAFENIPFEWSPLDVDKREVFLIVDRSNPNLDRLTDEWLKKNDPKYNEQEKKNQKEAEDLFVLGPKKKPN